MIRGGCFRDRCLVGLSCRCRERVGEMGSRVGGGWGGGLERGRVRWLEILEVFERRGEDETSLCLIRGRDMGSS